jgi:dTDP-glucose 4,6-dehydratase
MGKDDGGWNIGRYVPSVNLIKQDLGIEMTTSLDQAILRTALWHGWKGKK